MCDSKNHIQEKYGEIAKTVQKGCSVSDTDAYNHLKNTTVEGYSEALGYTKDDLQAIPEDSNLALGCGNPTAIASLKEGEVVIDLGSGGGFDCFLAAKKVGPTGRVIGVDMTEDMIALARKNASKGNYTNVEFHLGEIENLPVGDGIGDVIISNCVVTLSSNKEKVFKEAARVLKSGGRVAISDLVAIKKQPESFKIYEIGYLSWIYSSMEVDKLKEVIENAGFKDVQICVKECGRDLIASFAPGTNAEDYIAAAAIKAVKI